MHYEYIRADLELESMLRELFTNKFIFESIVASHPRHFAEATAKLNILTIATDIKWSTQKSVRFV